MAMNDFAAATDAAIERSAAVGALGASLGVVARHPETPCGGFALSHTAEDTLLWTELGYVNRKFVFNKNLAVCVTQENGSWVFESDEPKLMGFGEKRDDAELAFRQDFVAYWDYIAQEDDENLTQDAIEMKRVLLDLVKSQEPQ
jgi:hypothetical protein